MDATLTVSPNARIDAGLVLGSAYDYPHPGIEIGCKGLSGDSCITINCTGAQVREIVRALLIDFIGKAPIEHSQDILNEAAIELSRARRAIAEREAAACNP